MKDTTYKMVQLTLDGGPTRSPPTSARRSCRSAVTRFPHRLPPHPSRRRQRTLPEAPRGCRRPTRVPRTVQRWMRSGVLPSGRVVGSRRIPWSAICRLRDACATGMVDSSSHESTADAGCVLAGDTEHTPATATG